MIGNDTKYSPFEELSFIVSLSLVLKKDCTS
jgi:hypothetical protein